MSILLPPLGLVPGIKYIRGKNQNGKMVGTIAILLTIVGTVISIVVFLQVMDTVNKQVESQLQQYENLGY